MDKHKIKELIKIKLFISDFFNDKEKAKKSATKLRLMGNIAFIRKIKKGAKKTYWAVITPGIKKAQRG